MPTEIKCPECGLPIRVPPSYAGKRIKCPQCRERFRIPEGKSGTARAWYVKKSDGTQVGPVDRDVLDRWSREGRIDRDCLIRRTGTVTWQQATTVYQDLPAATESSPAVTPTLEDFDLDTMADFTATGVSEPILPANASLDANRSLSPDTPVTSPRIARVLAATTPITSFLAFAGFVTAGAIATLLVIRLAQALRLEDGAAAGWAAFDLTATCLLILLPTWHTFLYHRTLKEFVGSPTERQLASVLEQDQRFWKSLLVLPVVGLVYVLVKLIAGGSPLGS